MSYGLNIVSKYNMYERETLSEQNREFDYALIITDKMYATCISEYELVGEFAIFMHYLCIFHDDAFRLEFN